MIRVYKEKDRPRIKHICHETAIAPACVKSEELACLLYADYYIDHETDNCFVFTDEFDNAVGYVLCAPNFKKYQKDLRPYLKKVRQISRKEARAQKSFYRKTPGLRKKYPAHLYINILPSFRGRDGGRNLIETLLAHLSQKRVKGVMLSVGKDNTGAHVFYEKLGFKKMRTVGNAYIFAKELK